MGLKAYPKIPDVPEDIDLVFFLLPSEFVPTLFEDCEKKGVKAAVIIAAGFAEMGEEGLHSVLEDENVDAVLVILLALANADIDGRRENYQSAKEKNPDKPIYTVAIGCEVKERWIREVEGLNMPFFEITTIAVKALTTALPYSLDREKVQPDPILP